MFSYVGCPSPSENPRVGGSNPPLGTIFPIKNIEICGSAWNAYGRKFPSGGGWVTSARDPCHGLSIQRRFRALKASATMFAGFGAL